MDEASGEGSTSAAQDTAAAVAAAEQSFSYREDAGDVGIGEDRGGGEVGFSPLNDDFLRDETTAMVENSVEFPPSAFMGDQILLQNESSHQDQDQGRDGADASVDFGPQVPDLQNLPLPLSQSQLHHLPPRREPDILQRFRRILRSAASATIVVRSSSSNLDDNEDEVLMDRIMRSHDDLDPEVKRTLSDNNSQKRKPDACCEKSTKRMNAVIIKCQGCTSFECKICLEIARDPVVTPCGHLFCWPCLYQWLHAYSYESECPVCRREVLEVHVTPIYGGSDEDGKKHGFPGEFSTVPSRPHPCLSMESTRQAQRHRHRPREDAFNEDDEDEEEDEEDISFSLGASAELRLLATLSRRTVHAPEAGVSSSSPADTDPLSTSLDPPSESQTPLPVHHDSDSSVGDEQRALDPSISLQTF